MISDVILKVAAMEYAEEEEKAYYPRPSISGPQRCLRQMVYWAKGEKRKPLGGRAVVVFSDSSWQEELTFDLMRKSAYQVHSEQMPITIPDVFKWMPAERYRCSVCKEEVSYRDCHGHIDACCSDMLSKDYLVEHKALSMYGFEALWKGESPLDNFTQMADYFRGLQIDNPDLKEGFLLVKNKNQSGYLEFKVAYDNATDTLTVIERVHHTGERIAIDLVIPNITNDAFARFAEVEQHRVAGTLPGRQYEIDSWRCEYCSYFEVCYANYVEEHEKLTENVELEQDIVDTVRYERETALHESSAKKERDELKAKIKEFLRVKGVKSGRAGEYSVDWIIKTTMEFDKELLEPGVYQAAMKPAIKETLRIRKIKVEDVKNGRRKK